MTNFNMRKLTRASRRPVNSTREQSALIRQTDFGVIVELPGGRCVSLWAFALDEPVMDVALRRAQRAGALEILIDGSPAG
jgi:hypothetical protein